MYSGRPSRETEPERISMRNTVRGPRASESLPGLPDRLVGLCLMVTLNLAHPAAASDTPMRRAARETWGTSIQVARSEDGLTFHDTGEVFLPEQNLAVEEALAAYTKGAAHALLMDDAGVIRPGYLGDVVMLDRDPLAANW